eukprot:135465-Lingulodinium_polyedra.AAC.1
MGLACPRRGKHLAEDRFTHTLADGRITHTASQTIPEKNAKAFYDYHVIDGAPHRLVEMLTNGGAYA